MLLPEWLLCLSSFCSLVSSASFDYCTLECGKEHTMCKYKPDCAPKNCEKEMIPISDSMRKSFLWVHNSIRNKIALGNVPLYNLPTAANMHLVNWDYEMEKLAACWAYATCIFGHDTCRRTHENVYLGQNGLAVGLSLRFNEEAGAKRASSAGRAWFGEISRFPIEDIYTYFGKSIVPDGGNAWHFTQLIWGAVTHIGCGMARFKNKSTTYIYCNYKPGGNVAGGKIYELGVPCSKCENGERCNSEFIGLCGEDKSGFDLTYNDSLVPYVLRSKATGLAISRTICLLILYKVFY